MSSRLAIGGKLAVMPNKAEQHRQVTSPYKRSLRVHWVIPTRSSVCWRRSFAFTKINEHVNHCTCFFCREEAMGPHTEVTGEALFGRLYFAQN